MKRGLTAILIAALLAGSISGCKQKQTEVTMGNMDIDFGDYKDSEDIPSWDGSELKLSVWQDANSPNAYERYAASPDDSVSPEIKRITGVSFDSDDSFDNSGNSFDAKITQIIASGDFPDIGVSLPDLLNLTKTDKLWDIEEYVKKYCPNIMKLFGPDTAYGSVWKEQKEKYGGLYALALGNNTGMLKKMNEDGSYDLTNEQIESAVGKGTNPYGYVYIREDILKKLYPEAHTNAELEEIYKNNGTFTKEEIFDVPLKSTQDFIDMLYKIQEMNLSDEEGKVYTMYTHEGSDNWTALTEAGGFIFGYITDYFNYIDLESGKAALPALVSGCAGMGLPDAAVHGSDPDFACANPGNDKSFSASVQYAVRPVFRGGKKALSAHSGCAAVIYDEKLAEPVQYFRIQRSKFFDCPGACVCEQLLSVTGIADADRVCAVRFRFAAFPLL